MVKEALDAFHQHDLKHALEVKKMDIKMDELFDQVKEDIIQMIKESNDKGDLTINFLMIAKYFLKELEIMLLISVNGLSSTKQENLTILD